MHKYLRAIGFSDYIHHKDISNLLNLVHEKPDNIETTDVLDSTFVTMEKDFGEHFGIGIFGEYDNTDRFQIEYYYPYYKSSIVSSKAPCSILRHSDRYAFSAICEEFRLGISMIFYLQNTNGYLDCVTDQIPLNHELPICLNAMTTNAAILLPILKTAADRKRALVSNQKRIDLIESAKNGDEEAIESLALYDIGQYSQASLRILKEDLYSIIDTCFMPAGVECDHYAILGDILECEQLTNSFTNEKLYRFLIECNDIQINLIMNQSDLIGEPAVGRRFKGDIWLQGRIQFPEKQAV